MKANVFKTTTTPYRRDKENVLHKTYCMLIVSCLGRRVPSVWIEMSEFVTEGRSFGIKLMIPTPGTTFLISVTSFSQN